MWKNALLLGLGIAACFKMVAGCGFCCKAMSFDSSKDVAKHKEID